MPVTFFLYASKRAPTFPSATSPLARPRMSQRQIVTRRLGGASHIQQTAHLHYQSGGARQRERDRTA
jgi:hypothetical protein